MTDQYTIAQSPFRYPLPRLTFQVLLIKRLVNGNGAEIVDIAGGSSDLQGAQVWHLYVVRCVAENRCGMCLCTTTTA